ncbi:Rieske 2Fe-2S domain-containing protein [Streptomyces sp. NPDC001276]|uniref:Rieske 2Fe-2S domain-containing protein n=1 Tax=Streptomyces sp. NPDC001276 TaxID=3364555 RepID=UPI0036954EE3
MYVITPLWTTEADVPSVEPGTGYWQSLLVEDDPDPEFRTYCHLFAVRRPWLRGCIDDLPRGSDRLGSPLRPNGLHRKHRIEGLHQYRVFGANWVFVGHESEVPAPGNYVTRRLRGDPVILSRTEDNGVQVMLNSCTHRGTQVCKASYGNTTTFRCGYHGWVFGNDGTLKGVPGRRALYGPDFDLSKRGLGRARVETLHGFVFATWRHDGSCCRSTWATSGGTSTRCSTSSPAGWKSTLHAPGRGPRELEDPCVELLGRRVTTCGWRTAPCSNSG